MALLLLTGASGLVGGGLLDSLPPRFRTVALGDRHAPRLRAGGRRLQMDLTDAAVMPALLDETRPDVVVNAAAIAALGACEEDPEATRRCNVEIPRRLAEQCAARGIYLVQLSTDQVFGGTRGHYAEDDPPRPLTEYGRTKHQAEQIVQQLCPDACILRTSLILGPSPSGASGALDMLRKGGEVRLFQDEWRSPISILDLSRLLVAILEHRPRGLLHAAGPDRVSRVELGRAVQKALGLDTLRITPASRADMPYPRPRDVSLRIDRLRAEGLPEPAPLDQALTALASLVGGR